MNFYNGHWEKQYGVSMYHPQEIYEWHRGEEELVFLAPHQKIYGKGMTLDGVVLTFHVSVGDNDIFHIVVEHYQGQVERGLALKQPHAVFLLQALDVAAQGLLADVEPLRRPGKIHLLRGNQEILDAL